MTRWSRVAAAGALVALTCSCNATGGHVSGTAAPTVAGAAATQTATARPAADGVQQVVIDAVDGNQFAPNVISAMPGRIRVTVTNTSVVPVDFAIPLLNVHSPTIFAGNSETVMVDATAAGDYRFVCTFHEHDGMIGDLIVG